MGGALRWCDWCFPPHAHCSNRRSLYHVTKRVLIRRSAGARVHFWSAIARSVFGSAPGDFCAFSWRSIASGLNAFRNYKHAHTRTHTPHVMDHRFRKWWRTCKEYKHPSSDIRTSGHHPHSTHGKPSAIHPLLLFILSL